MAVLLATLFFSIIINPAQARFRFEEGDWIAWGDTRRVTGFEIGRNTVFLATDAGLLRWDRQTKSWLYPWFTVPGYLDKAILLTNCRKVLEDPLTLDLYVETTKGWYWRDNLTQRWEITEEPTGNEWERISSKERFDAEPSIGLIMPVYYSLTPDLELDYRFLRWEYSKGAYDPNGHFFFAWEGFGTGIAGEFSSVIELYPGGPGASKALDIAGDDIWAASTLDRKNGWLWHRNRTEDRWNFFHPDLEWGLETGAVNRLRIADNGTVWLGTTEGVMVRRGKSWRHIRRQEGLPRQVIRDIVPFGNDNAWVATHSGLALVDAKSGVVLRPDEKTENILRIQSFDRLTALGDTLWAAGAGRFFRYDKGNGWRSEAGAPTIAVATSPTALYASEQVLAIGDRMGFAWRDSTGQWREIFSSLWREGQVKCIVYHGGYFWLGTDGGLVKYDPVEGDAIRYTSNEGLAGNIVYEIIPEGDWLWLGTNRALVRFHWYVKGRLD